MKISEKETIPWDLLSSGQGLGGYYVTPQAPPCSGQGLSDHIGLVEFKNDTTVLPLQRTRIWCSLSNALGPAMLVDKNFIITDLTRDALAMRALIDPDI